MKDIHFHIMEPHSLVPEQDYQIPTLENAHFLVKCVEETGLKQACIPAISLYDPADFPCNPLALYAKTLAPEKIYALAGLRYSVRREENTELLQQAEKLLEAGFDGFKMICKPNARRAMKFGLDDPIFDAFFDAAEKNQWPILYHVGDPATFWDPQITPEWAKQAGWYYGDDEDIPSYEGLYQEVERMMERHPKLKVTFAHFFFLSWNFERLQTMFDRYPNMRVDVTPGREMYEDFAADPDRMREFFTKNQGRIMVGSDNRGVNGELCQAGHGQVARKLKAIRGFFETDGLVEMLGLKLYGAALEGGTMHALLEGSFDDFLAAERPRTVNPEAAVALCRELAPTADFAGRHREGLARLYKDLEEAFSR